MTSIKHIVCFALAALMLCACRKHEELFFDTPFVRIEDATGASTMDIDHTLDNLLSDSGRI